MLVLKSEEPYDENKFTFESHAWRAHHLRILVLTCENIGEREYFTWRPYLKD
jgi:hypothetical protein